MVGATLSVGAFLVVAYSAIVTTNEQALGAQIALLSAGVGYFLRGKVQSTS
jgi:hypothetical protein